MKKSIFSRSNMPFVKPVMKQVAGNPHIKTGVIKTSKVKATNRRRPSKPNRPLASGKVWRFNQSLWKWTQITQVKAKAYAQYGAM
ncbi:MAG: hypothetical protein P8P30_04135 [Rickettsiales bacterium]|nr:hypothetical protein [Rickettsiales bacterium]